MTSVMVVDDEPMAVRVVRLGLENAGFEVVTAAHGEEAMSKLRERSVDVVITDMNMPRMDGKELCRTIREELSADKPLIFIVTARPGPTHRAWAGEVENVEFFEKPASLSQLIGRIRELTQEPPGAAEVR